MALLGGLAQPAGALGGLRPARRLQQEHGQGELRLGLAFGRRQAEPPDGLGAIGLLAVPIPQGDAERELPQGLALLGGFADPAERGHLVGRVEQKSQRALGFRLALLGGLGQPALRLRGHGGILAGRRLGQESSAQVQAGAHVTTLRRLGQPFHPGRLTGRGAQSGLPDPLRVLRVGDR